MSRTEGSCKPVNVDVLRAKLERVIKLTDDAHPGLITWSEMFGKALEEAHRTCTDAILGGVDKLQEKP